MADLKISQLTGATTPLAGTEVVPVVQSSTTKKVAVSDLTAGRDVNAKSIALTGVAATGYLSMTAGGTTTNYNLGQITNTGGGLYWGVDNNAGTAFGGNTAYGGVVATSTATDLSLGVNNAVKWRISNATGDLVQVVAGDGVNFTANTPAAGMTSQLLNWYEEGTWTPAVRFGGGTTGITYSRQNGRYTRVGKLVTVTWDVRLSNKGSSTGAFTLAGLPFSAEGAGGGYSTSQFYFYSGFTTIKKMGTSYTNGGTTLDEVVDSADVAVSDTHFTNTSILFGSLTYLAA